MFLENVKDLYKKYDDTEAYQRARAALISAISILEEMITYFNNLIILLEYITDGLLYEKDIYPDAFANHKKYREMKREYDETSVKKIYEELATDLDYDRYEVDPRTRLYKINPLTGNRFRKTAKHIYKYKTLQNSDEVVARRGTMKRQLHEQLGINTAAQQASRLSHVSV